tara:strand:- start:555 stop:695 length:141 start_codon:yes stop_codon:yes gene_type:complete
MQCESSILIELNFILNVLARFFGLNGNENITKKIKNWENIDNISII